MVELGGQSAPSAQAAPRGGVQSIDRAFLILETMADAGGVLSISQLADRAGLPLATIHRVVRTLLDLGYVRQEASREYSLGPRLMRLSDAATKRMAAWTRAAMSDAVGELGESINLAILDGDEIVYVAQAQPENTFMRMFTEVGRRTLPHSTAVGKAILADYDDDAVVALLRRTRMPRHTAATLTTPAEFLASLEETRARGFAIDEGEQEIGVRCVAVRVPDAPRPMALSMSGPTTRVDDEAVAKAAVVLTRAADRISSDLAVSRG